MRSRHNVVPSGIKGDYRCRCGARFSSLPALTSHLSGERSGENLRRAEGHYRRAVRLMAELEALYGRREDGK